MAGRGGQINQIYHDLEFKAKYLQYRGLVKLGTPWLAYDSVGAISLVYKKPAGRNVLLQGLADLNSLKIQIELIDWFELLEAHLGKRVP